MQYVGKDSQRSTFLLPMVALFDKIVPAEVQLEHDIEGPTIISIPAVYLRSYKTTLVSGWVVVSSGTAKAFGVSQDDG